MCWFGRIFKKRCLIGWSIILLDSVFNFQLTVEESIMPNFTDMKLEFSYAKWLNSCHLQRLSGSNSVFDTCDSKSKHLKWFQSLSHIFKARAVQGPLPFIQNTHSPPFSQILILHTTHLNMRPLSVNVWGNTYIGFLFISCMLGLNI
jgi:hypothetical protein